MTIKKIAKPGKETTVLSGVEHKYKPQALLQPYNAEKQLYRETLYNIMQDFSHSPNFYNVIFDKAPIIIRREVFDFLVSNTSIKDIAQLQMLYSYLFRASNLFKNIGEYHLQLGFTEIPITGSQKVHKPAAVRIFMPCSESEEYQEHFAHSEPVVSARPDYPIIFGPTYPQERRIIASTSVPTANGYKMVTTALIPYKIEL
jgi:hypothetical protein